MNRSSNESATVPSDALAQLRPAPAAKASQSDDGATIAYQPAPDTASRVLNQLEGLASSLEKAAAAGGRALPLAAGDHGDEECLESYLQRYMQQLTGKTQEPPATSAKAVPETSSEAPPPEPKQQPRQPAQAPEDRLRITAMRELANDSARRAVAASNNSQLIDKTRINYLVTKVVSLVSIALVVVYFSTLSSIALASATVAFGLAFLGACRFALLCRKMGRTAEVSA